MTAAVFALLLAAVPAESPKLLIYYRTKTAAAEDPHAGLPNFLAAACDETRKVQSVVWGLSDPVFRDAVVSGRVKDVPDSPTDAQVQSIARILGCEYAAFIKVTPLGSRLSGEIALVRGGRQVWKDAIALGIKLDGGNADDSLVRSMANTWAQKLAFGPFKKEEAASNAGKPVPEAGAIPPTAVTPEPVTPKPNPVSDAEAFVGLQRSVRELATAGRMSEAVLQAKEAVDIVPLDIDRRMLFLEVLQRAGKFDLAASEAARASELFPTEDKAAAELRLVSARCFLATGNIDAAKELLNEAATRQPNSVPVRNLMAELALRALQPGKALESLTISLKEAPSAEGSYLRAVTRAVLGGEEGSIADLEAAVKEAPDLPATRFELTFNVLNASLSQELLKLRENIAAFTVNRKSSVAAETLADISRKNRARLGFATKYPAVATHDKSWNLYLLAENLMAQVVESLNGYSASGGEENLTDARIDVGEAMKSASAAMQAYRNETEK